MNESSQFTRLVMVFVLGFTSRGLVENYSGGFSLPVPGISQTTPWTALSDHILAGEVKDTDELIRIVKVLDEQGHVDFGVFAATFPEIAATKGPMTGETGKDIAQEIRKL